MERILTITGRTGRYNASSFVWTENEPLTVRVVVKENRVGKYVVSARHGKSEKTVVLDETMTIEFSPEWLKGGGEAPLELIMEFRTRDLGRVIIPSADRDMKNGGFIIEPLQIERIDKQYTAIGYFEIIETLVKTVNGRLDQVNERLAQFEDTGVPLRFVDDEEETENTENEENENETESET